MDLLLLTKLQWTPFDKMDWNSYSGCVSETPHIAELDDVTYIIDGDTFVVSTTKTETHYELRKMY